MTALPVLQTNIPGIPAPRRGKVRDIYDLGNQLLLVATDRISAFDQVLPTGIPNKGRVLTQISEFWFSRVQQPHHRVATTRNDLVTKLPASFLRNFDWDI